MAQSTVLVEKEFAVLERKPAVRERKNFLWVRLTELAAVYYRVDQIAAAFLPVDYFVGVSLLRRHLYFFVFFFVCAFFVRLVLPSAYFGKD